MNQDPRIRGLFAQSAELLRDVMPKDKMTLAQAVSFWGNVAVFIVFALGMGINTMTFFGLEPRRLRRTAERRAYFRQHRGRGRRIRGGHQLAEESAGAGSRWMSHRADRRPGGIRHRLVAVAGAAGGGSGRHLQEANAGFAANQR